MIQLKKQVCSLDLSKKLVELGVKAEPLFWHVINIDLITPHDIIQKWQHSNFNECEEKYPAYTVAELGMMLPQYYESHKAGVGKTDSNTWYCGNLDFYDGQYLAIEKTEANARAKMLIELIQNDDCSIESLNSILVE